MCEKKKWPQKFSLIQLLKAGGNLLFSREFNFLFLLFSPGIFHRRWRRLYQRTRPPWFTPSIWLITHLTTKVATQWTHSPSHWLLSEGTSSCSLAITWAKLLFAFKEPWINHCPCSSLTLGVPPIHLSLCLIICASHDKRLFLFLFVATAETFLFRFACRNKLLSYGACTGDEHKEVGHMGKWSYSDYYFFFIMTLWASPKIYNFLRKNINKVIAHF